MLTLEVAVRRPLMRSALSVSAARVATCGSHRPRNAALMMFAVCAFAACGGGVDVGVGIGVSSGDRRPEVVGLTLQLSRVAPYDIQLAWDDDPRSVVYEVSRNGSALARVRSNGLVDAGLPANTQFCYRVAGYGDDGVLLSTTREACISTLP